MSQLSYFPSYQDQSENKLLHMCQRASAVKISEKFLKKVSSGV